MALSTYKAAPCLQRTTHTDTQKDNTQDWQSNASASAMAYTTRPAYVCGSCASVFDGISNT